jgi:ketosteroid isomerase-like protein
MSEENVEILRQAGEEWRRRGGGARGTEAIPVEVYADDVEWDISGYPTVDLPTRGSGRDNLLDAFRTYYRGWTSYQADFTGLIDAGENVVGVIHEKAGVGDSDALLERDVFNVWTLRNGLVVKMAGLRNAGASPGSRRAAGVGSSRRYRPAPSPTRRYCR